MNFRDLFRPRPRPSLRNCPDSPDVWFPGDIALCTGTGAWESVWTGDHYAGPRAGEMMRVSCVHLVEGRQFLIFALWPGSSFAAHSFVKAKPDAHEGSRQAWRDLLKRHRHRVDA